MIGSGPKLYEALKEVKLPCGCAGDRRVGSYHVLMANRELALITCVTCGNASMWDIEWLMRSRREVPERENAGRV